MSFAEVDGMWLRTFTHAVADVRFKGKYVMESRDLEYRFTRQTASRSRRKSCNSRRFRYQSIGVDPLAFPRPVQPSPRRKDTVLLKSSTSFMHLDNACQSCHKRFRPDL